MPAKTPQTPFTKDAILALTSAREVRTVTIDGVGTFRIRELSGADRNAFEQSTSRVQGDQMVPNLANFWAKLVAFALVDESGERMFTSADDIAELGKLPGRVLKKLFDEVADMNAVSDEEIEEIEGNSDAAQGGASTSA